MKNYLLGSLLIIIFSFFTIKPLFSSGYFPMHDDTQVGRTVVMGRALLHGQFPVRWVSDLGYGYGYPIFNFYGPLPYYVSGTAYALGFSALHATKGMMLLGFIAAPLLFFLLFSRILSKEIAIVGAILYTYAPYHAVQLYVRGSVGEFWVLVFLPLLLSSLFPQYSAKHARLLGGIGLAGVILSHTILGFVSALFIGIFMVIIGIKVYLTKKHSQYLWRIVGVFCVGLGVSAFFWLPAIFEMSYTNVKSQIGTTAYFGDHFVCPSQLIYSSWGFGGSIAGCTDGLSFAVGKLYIILILSGIASWIFFRKKIKYINEIGIAGIIISFGSLFLLSPFSSVVWQSVWILSFIQYPWRFFTFFIFGSALLGVLPLLCIRPRVVRIGACILVICLAIGIHKGKFSPQYMYGKSSELFETTEELRFRVSKISDEYLPPNVPIPKDQNSYVKQVVPEIPNHQIKTVTDWETTKKFEITGKSEIDVILNHADFPGWVYKVNGVIQTKRDKGRPVVTIPADFSTLEMYFYNTPIRTMGNVISLVVMVLLVYIYGKKTFN